MYPSVSAAFLPFTRGFEGHVPWMYLDVLGLVTVGYGDLIDPITDAIALPFVHRSTGFPATGAEVAAEWRRVKALTRLAQGGGGNFRAVTTLDITETGLLALVSLRLGVNETRLRARFRSYDTWPADAQLGVHSMAWAMGPVKFAGYPHFSAAANAQDFVTAAAECTMSELHNAPVHPRNVANRILFTNAAIVLARGLDASTLYYPEDLSVAA